MKAQASRIALLLALGAAAPPAAAQELGRLFFTPEQRAALDARRRARVPDKPAAAPIVASPTTRLDGYVSRSSGRATVWLNGEAWPESAPDAPRIAPLQDSVLIPIGETGGRARLRPGEILDRGTGEVRDVLGEGRVDVRPFTQPSRKPMQNNAKE